MGKHEVAIAEDPIEVLHRPVPGPMRLRDRRRHKRRSALKMKLTFLGADHDAINWSVGGVLVKDTHPETPIGTTTPGFLSIVGAAGRFAVSIELVRRDRRSREIAFRFVEPSQALVDTLTRFGS